ncbi:hypothetical protein AX15_000501 [Amanita polypyramis BW_CC]|nr:hypothetical protein AX15_000501 [Amanita polypyramis BW_CC]
MQTYANNHNDAWASGSNRPNPAVPRSTSVEYEKETHQTSLRNRLAPPPSRLNNSAGAGLRTTVPQGTRRPLSKTASVHHVPDSEGEGENGLDAGERGKSPLNQVIDVAKRALAPATFYLRQRSQEPEGPGDKSNISTMSNTNGQNSSYDYSAEEREFQANRSQTSVKPISSSGAGNGRRKNRMSIDNKAYKPPPSDAESSEEYSDDGKGRRRRKKKRGNGPNGGPLTTLPVMATDKKKKRRRKSGTSVEGEEDDEGSESEGNTTAAEKTSNQRASVARSSVPPVSRQSVRRSVPPQPQNTGDVSLNDAEQGLHSIPEVEIEDEEVEAGAEACDAYDSELPPDPIPIQPSVPFSIGAFLGRTVHLSVKTCLNLVVFFVNILSGLFFVIGRILGTIVEIILIRPLRVIGLVGPGSSDTDLSQRPAKSMGKYLLIGLAILGAWHILQEPNSLPFPSSIPSLFAGKGKSTKHDRVFVAPEGIPANLEEIITRLQTMESAISELAHRNGDRENNHDDLLNRFHELTEHVSREAREQKRVLDNVEGRVRDGVTRRIEEHVERRLVEGVDRRVDRLVDQRVDRRVEEGLTNRMKEVERKVIDGVIGGELGSVKKDIEVLKTKAASASASGIKDANDDEARAKIRVLEERLGEIEGEVTDLGKKAIVPAASATHSGIIHPWWTRFSPSKGSSQSGIMIKSTDGQDITALLDQLVTSSVLTHLHKDALSKPDYALFSAGARVIPSLTSPTLELRPPTVSSRFLAFVTGHGYALGRPPVTALHHEVQNGFCWPFSGSQGQLGVALAAPVKVESISIDHVPKEVAFDVRSAPREMEVWGLVEGEDNVKKVKERRVQEEVQEEEYPYPPTLPRQPEYVRVANFTYDADGPSHVQNFPVLDEIREMGLDFGIVVLLVKSNWGREDFTCLYRFRVHGTRLEAALGGVEGTEAPAAASEKV